MDAIAYQVGQQYFYVGYLVVACFAKQFDPVMKRAKG